MSGSSSLASARRRRAAPQINETPVQRNAPAAQNNVSNNQTMETKQNPLQLLNQHESKINEIENNLTTNITNIVTQKINQINLNAYTNAIKNLQNEVILLKSAQGENNKKNEDLNIDNNLENMKNEMMLEIKKDINIQVSEKLESAINNIIDKKLHNFIETNIDTILDAKQDNLKETVSNILVNMENLSKISNSNIINKDKIEEMVMEVNSLKVLLIKNQTLALDTTNQMQKLKSIVEELEIEVDKIKNTEEAEPDIMSFMRQFTNEIANKSLNIHNLEGGNNEYIDDIEEIEDIENVENIENMEENIKAQVMQEIINIQNLENINTEDFQTVSLSQ